jgi:hypothetical protein
MKQLIVVASALTILSGCAWIAANPQADAEAIELAEEGISEIYHYETHTLLPAPPSASLVMPPVLGPNGPKGK